MATIGPFQALRPAPALASQVASRPYDVLNSHEAREEAADNPYSFLHITKPEIDMPLDVDTHSQPVYDQAKKISRHLSKRAFCCKRTNPVIISTAW